MGKPIHRMLSKDLDRDTGVCAACGPVQLDWHTVRGERISRCPVGRALGRQSPNRSTGTGGQVGPHGLTSKAARAAKVGKKCEICGRTDKLCIDHLHGTKGARGILCDACNKGLGFFRDSPDLLANAIDYLQAAALQAA